MADGQIIIEKLSDDFQIDFAARIESLSSPFATAYEVRDTQGVQDPNQPIRQKYALVYNKEFPTDLDKIISMKNLNSETLGFIYEMGKVVNPSNSNEQLAVILSRPRGQSLLQIINSRGALEENFVLNSIFQKTFSAIAVLHSIDIMHGSINIDNIYYDNADNKVYLREPFSEYCGFRQPASYETFERTVCHPAAKNDLETEADYYAAGVAITSAIFGGDPYLGEPKEIPDTAKFEHGSFDAIYIDLQAKKKLNITGKTENIIRGLLSDKIRDRWGEKEVRSWYRREAGQSIISKIHKHAATPFEFNDREIFSTKYLAKMIHDNWVYAKNISR